MTWVDVGTDPSPLDLPNTHGLRSLLDPTHDEYTDYLYRVVAQNTVGYLDAAPPLPGSVGFPNLTVQSVSATVLVLNPPKAPTGLTATL